MLKRLIHVAYFVKSCDWKKLRKQSSYVQSAFHQSRFSQFRSMLRDAFKYGMQFHDYYYFGFYQKSESEKKEYASMSFMHALHKKFNTNSEILNDKLLFNEKYSEFVKRGWLNLQNSDTKTIEDFIRGKDKVVLKRSKGTVGKDVLIVDTNTITSNELERKAKKEHYNLMEEFVYQHHDLQALSPNSLNTIRIITMLKSDNNVDIFCSLLRMGVDKKTDNFSTGGIAALIDVSSGRVSEDAISIDISESSYSCHPVSKMKIKGFQIPYWDECIKMVEAAARKYPENKTVGWDVAVCEGGPVLIEGNHNWGIRMVQMTVGGVKKRLLKYMEE